MKALLNRFAREEAGQDLIEYGLLLGDHHGRHGRGDHFDRDEDEGCYDKLLTEIGGGGGAGAEAANDAQRLRGRLHPFPRKF